VLPVSDEKRKLARQELRQNFEKYLSSPEEDEG